VRVLFTAIPARGHVHPMIPLARAFEARGHEVLWATADPMCGPLRAGGFDAVAAGLPDEAIMAELGNVAVAALPPEERPEVAFPHIFGAVAAPAMLADLLPIARDWRPDLLVGDQAELAGPIAAAAIGVPRVTHGFGCLLPPARVARAAEAVAPLWQAEGLAPRPYAGTYDSLYLDIYPPGLAAAAADHVSHLQPLRPEAFALDGEEDDPVWPGDDERPLVYVTFGTVFNRDLGPLETAVRALRDLPVRVVVTLGPGRDPGLLGDQPPNVLVAGYVPQTRILPGCAAVLSHGGSGTFLAALAHGLPQVILPQGADQFLNARAGAASGAAFAIPPRDLDAGAVRAAALRALEDPAPREAARGLAAEIRAMPGPGEVAALIEERLG
jgi:UDP:flavonoid glycosyltransferase YjiC (YdhE family)